jgi:hypothetical protein
MQRSMFMGQERHPKPLIDEYEAEEFDQENAEWTAYLVHNFVNEF